MKIFTLQKDQWIFGLSFIAICAINYIIYQPSFYHVARSDQIIYLANTAHQDSFFDLAFSHYNYDRVRHYFWGWDARLFRPLFFFILGTKKFLFEYNFYYWQLTSFVLHLFVQFTLLRLLCRMGSVVMAGALTLWFSTLLAGIEMVTWHHISPYLLFIALILMALDQLFQIIQKQSLDRKRLIITSLILFFACFIYEIGCIIGGLCFVFTAIAHYRLKKEGKCNLHLAWSLLILVPSIIYTATYFLDLWIHQIDFVQAKMTADAFSFSKTFGAFGYVVWWVIYTVNFSLFLEVMEYQRTVLRVFEFQKLKEFTTMGLPLKAYTMATFALWTAFAMMIVRGIAKKGMKHKWLFASLIGCIALVQTFIIIIGRSNLNQLAPVLQNNSYYAYLVWLYVILLIGVFAGSYRVGTRFATLAKGAVIMLLIGAVFINARAIYDSNQERTRTDIIRFKLLKEIRMLDRETKGKFSFALHPSISPEIPWVKPDSGDTSKKFRFMELLYPEHFDMTNPQYIFVYMGDGQVIKGKRY